MKIRTFSVAALLAFACGVASGHDEINEGFLITVEPANGMVLAATVVHSVMSGDPIEKKYGFELVWRLTPPQHHNAGNSYYFVKSSDEANVRRWVEESGVKIISLQPVVPGRF